MIKRFLQKPYRPALVFSLCLGLAFGFVLLDAFLIPKPMAEVAGAGAAVQIEEAGPAPSAGEAQDAQEESLPVAAKTEPRITADSYQDDSIQISIETLRLYESTVYVAEIRIREASLLKAALAQDTFGRNIKATPSQMAEDHGAILAINGDYYGFRDAGYVVRNGVVYRTRPRGEADDDALLIDGNGDFYLLRETQTDASELIDAWQVFSFGPALVAGGEPVVDESSEVTYSPHSRTENPRTAIGQIGPLHYVFVVAEGRTGSSRGLTLLELADLLVELGCQVGYNLDGGGSSTMVFQGEVLNHTSNGRSAKEREISDIVYIGDR